MNSVAFTGGVEKPQRSWGILGPWSTQPPGHHKQEATQALHFSLGETMVWVPDRALVGFQQQCIP